MQGDESHERVLVVHYRQKIVRAGQEPIGDFVEGRSLFQRRNRIAHEVADRLLRGRAG